MGNNEISFIGVVQFIINSPFEIKDFMSFALLVVGVVFGISAVFSGYKSDDSYPGFGAVQRFKDNTMKRYDVKVPYNIADEEKEMVVVASISEQNKLNLLRELSIKLVRQILLHWDEYEHQMSRELDDLFEEKGDK